MQIDPIQPPGWATPKGYSNGMLVTGGGSMLFIAGQVAWDAQQQIVGEGDFVRQFTQALKNVVSVLTEAGGRPEQIVRMTLYLTDCAAYLGHQEEVGAAYRSIMGKHFPAMSAVQVAALIEPGALLEIEATAVLPVSE
ncbi:enamine deaminase RidA [Candidatus Woesearchaeota archaeon]|jgi:enamine deaminase RidA (YjgF/YER057c/UK114 family)|nr:enamine deaminase RidA [Candidatus Woesearchaeota archaeon]MDP6739168.1 RidA family protein [Planctomycetota bacterium]MDP6938431.1 RidA family protein [Planctomycetota bacterium]